MDSGLARFTHYVFHSVWMVEASFEDAFAVLRDLGTYPLWWPEIERVAELSDGRFNFRVKPFLPYSLEVSMKPTRYDLDAGVLEGHLSGDLVGCSRWTVTATPSGSRIAFDEDVVTNKRSLNLLAPLARLAFKANHSLMMRHGEAGLRAFLGGTLLTCDLSGGPRS